MTTGQVSVRPFSYVGRLPASKSLMNRALIVSSFAPGLVVEGESNAEDVLALRAGLTALDHSGSIVDCRHGGTTFRFLALRLSRQPGLHRLTASPRLWERPQDELRRVLLQLGVEVTDEECEGQRIWRLRSFGWHPIGDALEVPSHRSSQFASALALSAWHLPFDLHFNLGRDRVSDAYWLMTLRFLRQMGMTIHVDEDEVMIPRHQRVTAAKYTVEPDMSSAFTLAALSVVSKGGSARFLEFPSTSLQPDFAFSEILARMGADVIRTGDQLEVRPGSTRYGLKSSLRDRLRDTPDLFPVLAILAALSHGPSELVGAPQLQHKESDRVTRIGELVRAMGRPYEVRPDGLMILGTEPARPLGQTIPYDCDQDHRLVMAALVAAQAGFTIAADGIESIKKSLPELFDFAKDRLIVRS